MGRDELRLRLSEIQSKYTGKNPYGPVSDLVELYENCTEADRATLLEELDLRIDSAFWTTYVPLFRSEIEK